jgi:hypothetical protein
MITYEKIEENGSVMIKAIEGDDIYYIPCDLGNSSYQAYLKSLEA